MEERWRLAGRGVVVKNLKKLFFPESGLKKGDLLAYCREVAPFMLPHLQGRPSPSTSVRTGSKGTALFAASCPTTPLRGFPASSTTRRPSPVGYRSSWWRTRPSPSGSPTRRRSSSTPGTRALPPSTAPTGWCSTSIPGKRDSGGSWSRPSRCRRRPGCSSSRPDRRPGLRLLAPPMPAKTHAEVRARPGAPVSSPLARASGAWRGASGPRGFKRGRGRTREDRVRTRASNRRPRRTLEEARSPPPPEGPSTG